MWLTLSWFVRWQLKQLLPNLAYEVVVCWNVSIVVLASWLVPTSVPSGKLPLGGAPFSVQVAPRM